MRTIGSRGRFYGQIGLCCDGLRFTPDGQSIIAAECSNNRLSVFGVDGSFERYIGAGMISNGSKDDY